MNSFWLYFVLLSTNTEVSHLMPRDIFAIEGGKDFWTERLFEVIWEGQYIIIFKLKLQ